MRRSAFALTLVAVLAVASISPAARAARKAREEGTIELSLTPTAALPLGDWSDVSSFGVGASIDALFRLQPKLGLTASLGYLYFLDKSVAGGHYGTSILPLLAGLKYDLSHAFSVTGEIGLSDNILRWNLGSLGVSSSHSRIGVAVAGGVGYDLGPVALTGRLFGSDWGGGDVGSGFNWALLVGVRIPIIRVF